jgi:DNA-binding transcriptional regulator YdaS (Cro superfamily)
MMKKSITEALKEAIEIAGGQTALAALISTQMLPVSQSSVRNWLDRESVPADYCPAIERHTGVLCELLRPNADWAYLRGLVNESAA